jgi:hypothetical protein
MAVWGRKFAKVSQRGESPFIYELILFNTPRLRPDMEALPSILLFQKILHCPSADWGAAICPGPIRLLQEGIAGGNPASCIIAVQKPVALPTLAQPHHHL